LHQSRPNGVEMLDADARALREACCSFEAKHGIEALLDSMAAIVQDCIREHGLNVEFFEDEIGRQNGEQGERGGG
jgi:hypothetical protein